MPKGGRESRVRGSSGGGRRDGTSGLGKDSKPEVC